MTISPIRNNRKPPVIRKLYDSITVCTVVQNCCKGDEPCQWNTPIFRPLEIRNPLTDRHEILTGVIMSGISPHMPTLEFLPLRWAVLHMREVVIVRVVPRKNATFSNKSQRVKKLSPNFLGACLKGVFSKVCGPISVKFSGFVEMDTLSQNADICSNSPTLLCAIRD